MSRPSTPSLRVIWLDGLIFFGLAVWFAIEFAGATTTHAQIGWAMGFVAAALFLALVKTFSWMLIFHQRTIRRLDELAKRCEK